MRVTLNTPRGSGFGQVSVDVSDDGSFTFEYVLPGQYLLHMRPSAAQRKAGPEVSGPLHVNVTGENIAH